MYPLVKPLLMVLNPEYAHQLTLSGLQIVQRQAYLSKLLGSYYRDKIPSLPCHIMGMTMPHPIGLAAGYDKNAVAVSGLGLLGFSAIEVGTVTLAPQPGNARPRLFRLRKDNAVINRLGFNSAGVETVRHHLHTLRSSNEDIPVIGVNVGKNKNTALSEAHREYAKVLQKVYPYADYVTINVSSPNTPSLREMQQEEMLDQLLDSLMNTRENCYAQYGRRVAIAVKVSPDLDSEAIARISRTLLRYPVDALIATNTMLSRAYRLRSRHREQPGGLSGAPLRELSTAVIRSFCHHLQGKIPIIGVGGIANAEDAWQKLLAGADFLQVYSMLVYNGPRMVATIVEGLQQRLSHHGFTSLAEGMKTLRYR